MTVLNFQKDIGKKMHKLAKELWPINRSITGNGVRKTLKILTKICPTISIVEVPSGSKVFDWVVPNEWNANEAWIKNPKGKKIVDFSNNNFRTVPGSVVRYSAYVAPEVVLMPSFVNKVCTLLDN